MTTKTARGYSDLGAVLDRKLIRKLIADYLGGKKAYIGIGRSCNQAGFSNSTPVIFVEGDSPPELKGRPYLKTNFRRGSFSKTLYTPSTLRVEVGREWGPIKHLLKGADDGEQN